MFVFKFSQKSLHKQHRETFPLVLTTTIFNIFLIGASNSCGTSHEISLISQCDKFDIAPQLGNPGTGDVTRQNITLPGGTNCPF